jgi:hypothetical protein
MVQLMKLYPLMNSVKHLSFHYTQRKWQAQTPADLRSRTRSAQRPSCGTQAPRANGKIVADLTGDDACCLVARLFLLAGDKATEEE